MCMDSYNVITCPCAGASNVEISTRTSCLRGTGKAYDLQTDSHHIMIITKEIKSRAFDNTKRNSNAHFEMFLVLQMNETMIGMHGRE